MPLLNKEYKRVVENIFSLSILNGISYIFPIILIPYLTKTIGTENYGKYSFAYSVLLYFTMLVSYGFDLSATKKIAINRNNKHEIQRIFSGVLYSRILISILCILILIIITFSIDRLYRDFMLYIPGIGFIISFAINPQWLYQGMEKMKFITIISFIARSSTLILIFVFVKNKSDYLLTNFFFSIGFVLSAMISLAIVILQFKLNLRIPAFSTIYEELKDGWHIFISTVFMNFYRNSNVIILGLVANYEIVGIYAAAEKTIKAFQSVLSPITTALFPFFGRRLNSESTVSALKQYYKFARYYLIFLIIITFSIIFLAKPLITTFLPDDFSKSIIDIKIMSFVVLFGGLNYFYGINGLVNIGAQKQFTITVFVAGTFNIISCFILSKYFMDLGASISMILTEIILFIYILYYFKKNQKMKFS